MQRFLVAVLACGCVLVSGWSFAQQPKEDRMAADESQTQYTRKSITYLGITRQRNVRISPEALALVEKILRTGIELKRFDINTVDINKFQSIDGFVRALKDFVKERARDRAAAEADFDTRFKEARVLASDIDRIMNSTYMYNIDVFLYRVKHSDCPWNPIEATLQKCTPGASGMRVEVNADVFFYHAHLSDPTQNPYSLLKRLRELPGEGFEPYPSPPKPPEHPDLPADASDGDKKRARKRYKREMRAYQNALAEYRIQLPELRRQAALKATGKAVAGLSLWLGKSLKQISEFQLKTPVTAALFDGVEFMLGKREGLQLDDSFDVNEFDVAGKKKLIGYVKVRDIGDASGSGEGTPSYAEKVRVDKGFVGGESLIEHPMVGFNVGAHFVTEYLFDEFPFAGGEAVFFGAGVYVDYDLAPVAGLSEVYVSLEGDFLAIGEVGGVDANLVHAMAGIKKKWYINSFVVWLGVRVGVSYYVYDDDSEDPYIGAGADAYLAFEYYIMPEFSLYLHAAGRYFTNPLDLNGVGDSHPEMGVNASLGVRIGF
jgi:hypothetical protein